MRIASADPFAAPLIQPNYLAEPEDRKVLLAAMKLARRLLASEPLQPYYGFESYPGPGVQTDDVLLELVERSARVYASQGQVRTLVLALKLAKHKGAIKLPEYKVHRYWIIYTYASTIYIHVSRSCT